MNAFIVRPFGTRSGIDFDKVESDLIQPALKRLDIQGGTTGKISEAGGIREDMFQLLLTADLVIADISLHNANVFYELGIRHALRPGMTCLLRAARNEKTTERLPENEVPFDLLTERYLKYDSGNLEASLEDLVKAIDETRRASRQDSPVFRLLPDLQPQDRERFLPVPVRFREDVERAASEAQIGALGLLSFEAREFPWASEGLRLVGRKQFFLKAYLGARLTWEAVRELNPVDVEANLLLGTIYQRLGDLNTSDQDLERVLANKSALRSERAEAFALSGRNIKDRWRLSWESGTTPEERSEKALNSPYLLEAFEKYRQGFAEDLNSYFSGLNALSLLTICVELARKMPASWQDRFQSSEEADRELLKLAKEHESLAGAVGICLEAAGNRLKLSGDRDRWLDISIADHLFLTSERASAVKFRYGEALTGASDFHLDAALGQLRLFEKLNVYKEKVARALEVFPQVSPQPSPPERVVLFTGHMIDSAQEKESRFPDSCRDIARAEIARKLQTEQNRTNGKIFAIASAASGGDILFHEACDQLNILHDIYLQLPVDRFRSESVSPAGSDWEERFDNLMKHCPNPHFFPNSEVLSPWLSSRLSYNPWQRANIWLLQEAFALKAKNLTLLALWDGHPGNGPGGTNHMIRVAKQLGAATVIIDTKKLFEGHIH